MYLEFLIVLIIGFTLFFLVVKRKNKKVNKFPEKWKPHLVRNIVFYQNLDDSEKKIFEKKIMNFLAGVKINGANTEVTIEDKLMIASSAVIPIFHFKNWEYTQLREVLVYPDRFNDAFSQTDENRRVTGMVGSGVMDNVMIISKKALHHGFYNPKDKKNVAIHEFVHLLDKEDGAIDGVPEVLMKQQYVIPWMRLMKEKTDDILKQRSDLNPYGATKPEEFFAVASEYFFERPKELKQRHPKLYKLLTKIFHQDMASRLKKIFKPNNIGRNDPCPCGSGEKFKNCCLID